MRVTYLYDPQMNDLLDFRRKYRAFLTAFIVGLFTLLAVFSMDFLLLVPVLIYLGLLVWAAWPKQHAEYMVLEEHDHSTMENSTVT